MNVWDIRAVYRAIGITNKGNVIPAEMGLRINYAGMPLTVEPSATKRQRLYRIFVTCTCGKDVPYCKMPQHLSGKRHKGDAPIPMTPEALAIKAEDDARYLEYNKRINQAIVTYQLDGMSPYQ